MKLPHLVQYQGSKRTLSPMILSFLQQKFSRLIEPFAGTAAITIAGAAHKKAQKFLVNDLNDTLSDLLKLVVYSPEHVAINYERIWSEQHPDSIAHYYQIRDKFNQTKDPILFLYLLARCVKGAVRYNSEGLFNQSPDKRRLGTNPTRMKKNIYEISTLLKDKTSFFSLDYREILDMAKPNDIVYMDPPYQGVCGDKDSRYYSGINHSEFIAALDKLNHKGISYIVSYDGKCGNKTYGETLPPHLGLKHIYLNAGRSSQATLLGNNDITYESLYICNNLAI